MALAAPSSTRAVNPELAEERDKCSFRVIELTNILDGGSNGTSVRHEIEQKFGEHSKFSRYDEFSRISGEEYYHKAVKLCMQFRKKTKEHDLLSQIPAVLQFVRHAHVLGIGKPSTDLLMLHPLINSLIITTEGTEEQQGRWLPLAEKQAILGSYFQTELGHDINLQRLESTAHYDPRTEEFILHSPTLTSIKFWSGGFGQICNAAIITAQLYTKGVCHGPHHFFLQLRSLEGGKLLPGITIGEFGPKMGTNATDGGFLKLDHVRIPRTNMLMKHHQVLLDGTYVNFQKPLTHYKIPLMTRTAVILETTLRFAQAATVAIRFNAVRRQGGSMNPGELETKLLDYQSQQYNLFPQVAMAYAGMFAFRVACDHLLEFLGNQTISSTAELDAMILGLKALCSQIAVSGTELCRLSCGGLGYLEASRLPHIYRIATATCTYEGENTDLLVQTSRFLIKAYHAANNNGNLILYGQYLNVCRLDNLNESSEDVGTLNELLHLFHKTNAVFLSHIASRLVTMKTLTTRSSKDIWNRHTADLVKCARLHVQSFVLHSAFKIMEAEKNMSDSLKIVLHRLFELLALYWIRQNAGEFIQHGGVSPSAMIDFDSRLFDLLDELRPNIVGLVDAFDFRDESLRSVIGCYDGRIYERIHDYLMAIASSQAYPASEKLPLSTSRSKL